MTDDCCILFPASGQARRFGSQKLLALMDGMPVFCRTLENFAHCGCPLILAVSRECEHEFRRLSAKFLPGAPIHFVHGGDTRTETVFNGLEYIREELPRMGFVAVHDAARPLATPSLLQKGLDVARKVGAAVIARQATSTMKWARTASDGTVFQERTLPREDVWEAETPQIFRVEILAEAYRLVDWRSLTLTDDAQLVEAAGNSPVALVGHSGFNPKISFAEDMPRVLAAMRQMKESIQS